MTPFAIKLGTYDPFLKLPLRHTVGKCLPVVWQQPNSKLCIAYQKTGAPDQPNYRELCPAAGLLETDTGRVFGLAYAYDRKPGLMDMAERRLDLIDGLPRTQRRLLAWEENFCGRKPTKRRGDLYLTEWRRVHHPQVQWLTHTINPAELWLAYVLPDGRMLLGPAPLVHHEMAQYITYGWDALGDDDAISTVIELCKAYPDYSDTYRRRAVLAFYRRLLGKFGAADFALSNTASWARMYFKLPPQDTFWRLA